MGHSLPGQSATDRRRWTLLSAGAFGLAGLASAVVVWTALVLIGTGGAVPELPTGGALPFAAGVVGLLLVASVVGAATTGAPLWYLVEVLVMHADGDKRPFYPLLGGFAGVGAGILSHFVMWGIVGVVVVVVGELMPDSGGLGLEALSLAPLVVVFSLLFGGIVTVPVGGITGALLGYWRSRAARGASDPGPDGVHVA